MKDWLSSLARSSTASLSFDPNPDPILGPMPELRLMTRRLSSPCPKSRPSRVDVPWPYGAPLTYGSGVEAPALVLGSMSSPFLRVAQALVPRRVCDNLIQAASRVPCYIKTPDASGDCGRSARASSKERPPFHAGFSLSRIASVLTLTYCGRPSTASKS